MRGKAFFSRFLPAGSLLMLCLLLAVIAFGCKDKTEEVSSVEQTKEVGREEQTKEVSREEQKDEVAGEEQAKELTFDLDEVSAFELSEISRDFIRGQSCRCSDVREPKSVISAYPELKSGKPLYGSVRFSGDSAESKSSDGYHFAIDESGGTGTGYDRFYFDRNCDLDLTNDELLAAWKDPPEGALLTYSSIEQQVCFDSFDVTFDSGSAGKRAVEIMPRLAIRQGGRPDLSFVAAKARKGHVDIGGAECDVLLGYSYSVGRPLDQPGTVFCLIPKSDPQHPPTWWGADTLTATHAIDGKYYRFATTPAGEKLFVKPYDGAVGTFEVGAGGRDVQEVTMRGSLSSDDTAVAVGGELENGWPKPAKSCRVPVGDYLPRYLRIALGRLSIFISNNYHADGQPFGRGSRAEVYGIKIREDKPYIFDFSNKPDVMFASPAKGDRVKLGGELTVKAVLVDRELDIMIRDIEDTGQGNRVSLDPKVVITRSDGEKVAEGVMPFG